MFYLYHILSPLVAYRFTIFHQKQDFADVEIYKAVKLDI